MTIHDRGKLKQDAREDLAQCSYDPKKLILIHTGATIVLSLLLTLMDFVLDQQIGGTGGLGGVGVRAVLETVQSVLMIAQSVAVLFWQIGYVFTAIRISRREEVGPGSLLEGFRRFGPVLRLRLIIGLRVMGLCFGSLYLASLAFSLTPWAKSVMAAIESGSEALMLAAMEDVMLPWLGIVVLILGLVAVPYLYQVRMAEYTLMDDPKAGARVAILKSRLLMYQNRWNLFKLDLSFWWFYGMQLLAMVVGYGDLILQDLGVELPWSDTASYYIFLLLCYAAQLALFWWRGNEVQVTYANAYEALLPRNMEEA